MPKSRLYPCLNVADEARGDPGRKFFVFFTFLVVNFNGHSMCEERETLEQRAQMTDLERLRHSASHVLATAILKIWPEAQFAAGPPVENGFYYDVDLPHRIFCVFLSL